MAAHGSAKEVRSMPHSLDAMKAAVRTLLEGIGEDIHREGLLDTPKRVAKALLDVSHGYHQTASGVLGSAYFHEPIVNQGGEGLVLVRDIDFASTSEETLLPFYGRCHIGYVPHNGVVLGLSKLARLTRTFAKRLQTQERLGREVAIALQRQLQCQGVAVVIQAKHLTMNGDFPTLPITTACLSGCFTDSASSAFQEMLCMAGLDEVPAGSLLQLPSTRSDLAAVRRSNSSISNGSCSTSSGVAPCRPLPPSTPDLSDHLSESDSLHGVPVCVASSSSSKCDISGKMSETCSEKDLSDLVSGNSDRDLSEHDSDSETMQPHSFLPQLPQRVRLSASHPALGFSSAESSPRPVRACQFGTMQLLQHSRPATPTAMLPNGDLGLLVAAAGMPAADPRRTASADSMEQAVQTLIMAMGECPQRLGVLGSARRYVMTLLSATSGYLRQLPNPLYTTRSSLHAGTVATGTAFSSACPCCHGRTPSHTAETGLKELQQQQQGDLLSAGTSMGSFRHAKVRFTSQCEHHMLPFYGHAHVVYCVPSDAEVLPSHDSSEDALTAENSATGTNFVRDFKDKEYDVIEQVVRLYTQRLQVQERITHQVADGVAAVLGASHVLVLVDAAHMCMVARGVENHAGHTTSIAVRGGAVADAAWRARALQACRTAEIA